MNEMWNLLENRSSDCLARLPQKRLGFMAQLKGRHQRKLILAQNMTALHIPSTDHFSITSVMQLELKMSKSALSFKYNTEIMAAYWQVKVLMWMITAVLPIPHSAARASVSCFVIQIKPIHRASAMATLNKQTRPNKHTGLILKTPLKLDFSPWYYLWGQCRYTHLKM